jgi:predicted N-acetyltransferase YhbS
MGHQALVASTDKRAGATAEHLSVRPERREDEPASERVVEAAFESTVHVRLIAELRTASEYVAALSLVASSRAKLTVM